MRLEDFGDLRRPDGDPLPSHAPLPPQSSAGRPDACEAPTVTEARLETLRAEVEAARSAHEAAAEELSRLCVALAAVLPELRERVERESGALADAFRDAALACLPEIAEAGFAEEVSSAALRILRQLELPRAMLLVAPADVPAVLGRISLRPDEELLEIREEPSLPQGAVRLAWDDGGADLDRDRLLAAARDLHERRLAGTGMKEKPDDR